MKQARFKLHNFIQDRRHDPNHHKITARKNQSLDSKLAQADRLT
jgi:hypothetical protein